MIQFAYTILYVKDVVTTIEFYEKAFDFKRKFITPENEYGELATGNTILSFASIELAKSNLSDEFIESNATNKPFGVEVAFSTSDVQKVFDKAIKQGAIEVAKPKQKPWGQTVAYVKDPNGFLIEICTPVE
jgi:lactoylglutathione lyase